MRKTTLYGIRSIAEKLGISSSTVSRALNNHPRISRETRTKVLRTARELGRPADTNRPKVILLILPELRASLKGYSYAMIDVIRQECRKRGFSIEMIAADQLDILNDRDYAGAVCIDFSLQISRFWGKSFTIPLVMLNDHPNHLEHIYAVSSDALSAFILAVRHLSRNGHHRIGMLQFSGDDDINLNANHRREAFFQMMNSFGLGGGAFYGIINNEDPAFTECYEILNNRITALIVCGEGIAVYRTITFLKKSGTKVPDELSLITWETEDLKSI